MSVYSLFAVPDRLPDDKRLQAAAWQFQNAADRASGYASSVRNVADTIGPGVWEDSSSAHVKSLLGSLADELTRAQQAFTQANNALLTLSRYVAGQRPRYLALVARVQSAHASPASLVQTASESQEIARIELGVSSAMAQAAEAIKRCTAMTTRHRQGHSIWSRISADAEGLWHGTTDFASGLWDGTWALGEGIVGLAAESVKFSPERMLMDPVGYFKDLEHADKTVLAMVKAFASSPKDFGKAVGSSLADTGELKKDKLHWAGLMIPTIASMFADGGGLAAKMSDVAKAAKTAETVSDAEKAAQATRAAETAAKSAKIAESSSPERLAQLQALADKYHFPLSFVQHVLDGQVKTADGSFDGFHSAPGGIAPEGRILGAVKGNPLPNGVTSTFPPKMIDSLGSEYVKVRPLHTMFPSSWSNEKVLDSITEVLQKDKGVGIVVGTTSDGVEIRIIRFDGDLISAYPLMNP